jgi:hypothetical protein
MALASFSIETTELSFGEVFSQVYTFVQTYSKKPIVVATSSENVNVHITEVSTSSATISVSQKGTFKVYVRVIDQLTK